MILVFWLLSFKPAFSLSSFTFIKRLFSSSSLSAIRVVSTAYMRLLIFLPAILIIACYLFSLSFHTMYSAYKLNKQGDNIQPWILLSQLWTSPLFHLWFYLCFLSCIQVSQDTGKLVWYSHLFRNCPQFVVIHTVKGFFNGAEVDVFYGILLLFLSSSRCWQFNLWFLCLF